MAEPIDRTHLEGLASRFGADFLVQLIDLFISQGRERMTAAEHAVTSGDAAAIAAAAHAIKSSAGNLGATSLAQCAADVERDGRNGASAQSLAPKVQGLSEAFTAACTLLGSVRSDVLGRKA